MPHSLPAQGPHPLALTRGVPRLPPWAARPGQFCQPGRWNGASASCYNCVCRMVGEAEHLCVPAAPRPPAPRSAPRSRRAGRAAPAASCVFLSGQTFQDYGGWVLPRSTHSAGSALDSAWRPRLGDTGQQGTGPHAGRDRTPQLDGPKRLFFPSCG